MKNNKINIYIPEPCQENWQEMKGTEDYRFCNSCEKSVFDFTASSDREISQAFEKNKHLCGRFLNSQLERDLILPHQKKSIWFTTTSAIITFIALGTHKIVAQENIRIEQTDKRFVNQDSINTTVKEFTIAGVINDDKGAMPNGDVTIKNTLRKAKSDIDGNFSIGGVKQNDILVFTYIGYHNKEIKIINSDYLNVILEELPYSDDNSQITVGGVCIRKKRTFFGNIFYSIKNIFK